jgi:hypothetical protein
MNVTIKKFNVEMEVRNAGLEFEVRDTQNHHLGDLVLTKTKLIWCEGRVRPENGKVITWEDFRQLMLAQ